MIVGKTINSLVLPSLRYKSILGTIQFYSVYPKEFVKPIYKKDEQEAILQGSQAKEFAHVPIIPARNSDTCSEFHDPLVRKFTNYIMREGKGALAREIMEKTLENVKIMQLNKYYSTSPEHRDKIILDPKVILYQAVENCTPVLELQKLVRGGITYQIPVSMNANRCKFLSMNWLIRTAAEKGTKEKLWDTLAKELIDAAKNEGRAIKKKHDMHKQCEANRAYAHYRWL